MRALVHDPDSSTLSITEIDDPRPGPEQILVEVHTAGINFLDVAYRDANFAAGGVPGVDAGGVVVRAADDGSGPRLGARVTTFDAAGGAWAELRAVATGDVAVVPEGVDLEAAAALPAAGVTALQTVRVLGSLLGRRLLVTGAAGGVGRFAVQLAARAGADVVAVVGSPARGAGLIELGAREVVTSVADAGAVDDLIDMVGGDLLAAAFAQVRSGGRAISVGQASGQKTTLDLESERRRAGGTWLTPFRVQGPVGADLEVLLALVGRGDLDPGIGWRGSWTRVDEASAALASRRIVGKAVLSVDRSPDG